MRFWKILAIALLGFLSGGLSGVLVARHWPRPIASVPHAAPVPQVRTTKTMATTLLFMGTDETGGRGRDSLNSLTDTMLLIRVEGHHVAILAIPRDTRVEIPHHGICKINAANVYGGPKLSEQIVSRFLGVPIDHYMIVDLRGVQDLIQAMGGMEVTIPKPLHYTDRTQRLFIDLPQGRYHLNGRQVEAFLRFRHDNDGDIGRVERQQAFLMEFAHQFLTPRLLLHLPTLWNTFLAHGRTDLSAWQAFQLYRSLRSLDLHRDLVLTMLPGVEDTASGPWYWKAAPSRIDPFLERYFHRPFVPQASRSLRVTLEVAHGLPFSTIKALKADIERDRYHLYQVRRIRSLTHSRIIAQRGNTRGARALENTLGISKMVMAAIGDPQADFTVQIGPNWHPLSQDDVALPRAKVQGGSFRR